MLHAATIRFTSPINLEGSWGQSNVSKEAESVMDLFFHENTDTGFIDWEIEKLDMSESIGLWFEIDDKGVRTLIDYDGVHSLPVQAVDLMRSVGVIVPDEFDDRVQR